LQSAKGTTISPDHLTDLIDHIDSMSAKHRDFVDDEGFGFGDLTVDMFFLGDEIEIVESERILDPDTRPRMDGHATDMRSSDTRRRRDRHL